MEGDCLYVRFYESLLPAGPLLGPFTDGWVKRVSIDVEQGGRAVVAEVGVRRADRAQRLSQGEPAIAQACEGLPDRVGRGAHGVRVHEVAHQGLGARDGQRPLAEHAAVGAEGADEHVQREGLLDPARGGHGEVHVEAHPRRDPVPPLADVQPGDGHAKPVAQGVAESLG